MAPKTKGAAAQPAPKTQPAPSPNPPPPSNGVLTNNVQAPGGGPNNQKKAKRRQKQAQKLAAQGPPPELPPMDNPPLNGYAPQDQQQQGMPPPAQYNDPNFAADQYGQEDGGYVYSDEDPALDYDPSYPPANGMAPPPVTSKKKSRGTVPPPAPSADWPDVRTDPRSYPRRPPLSSDALRSIQRRTNDPMWDTNSMEERKRIKQFWLDLSEDKRRSLVNIEKRHVLEKMKEQQKHSCSCTVCGRKRTAIEEELEVLLQDPRIWADPTNPANASTAPLPPRAAARSRITELPDDEDGAAEQEDYDELSDEEEYDEDDSSDGADSMAGNVSPTATQSAHDFFQFGSSLTVKDGILTVAEDLLKNDGQKFIDMMEMLAEKRIQREEDAKFGHKAPYQPHYGGTPPPHSHPAYPPEEDEYDDDEEYSEDEEYDDEEEEDEMDAMTEDQRMEEGRRMFQIFAARMFEQRVVQAYKEKVAEERQRALIEDEESKGVEASAEKRAKAAEKKKRQREKAKETKAAKDAAKEEEKQRKEAAARELEEKKKEEQRQKQEEARKRKEAEREAQAEKKRRKEAEAQRRVEAERERQQEQERKAREQKAEEKRKREEIEKKKREEKEARDKEARERKAQADTERSGPDSKEKTTRLDITQDGTAQEATKRPSIPAAVALPPGLRSRPSQTESPQLKIATPALPKAPTPSKQREASSRHTSTPQTPERTPQSSKQSSSPRSIASQSILPPNMPPARSASQQYPPFSQQPAMSPTMRGVGPPPGMQHPSFGGMQPVAGFPGQMPSRPPGPYGPPMQSMHGPQRQYMPNAPPGMMPPGMPQHHGHPFGSFGAGYGQQPPLSNQTNHQHPGGQPGNAQAPPHHARQPSAHLDSPPTENLPPNPMNAPITRPAPAPIKRPASVKPGQGSGQDVDDLSNHLGSSALLEDSDVPLPLDNAVNRRESAAPGNPLSAALSGYGSPMDQVQSPMSRGPPHDNWGRPPFGPPGIGGQPGWGQQSGGWGGMQNHSHQPRPMGSRTANIRTIMAQSCRFLLAQRGSTDDGFLDYQEVLRNTMENCQHIGLVDPPVEKGEVDAILETLGDANNGGGTFYTRSAGQRSMVKFVEDGAANGPPQGQPSAPGQRSSGLGLGDIGSPRVEASLPNLGPGFGGMSRY